MDDIKWKWVPVARRTEYPKLGYLIHRMRIIGVRTRIIRHSWHAPILEIPEEHEDKFDSLLREEVFPFMTLDSVRDDNHLFDRFSDVMPDISEGDE